MDFLEISIIINNKIQFLDKLIKLLLILNSEVIYLEICLLINKINNNNNHLNLQELDYLEEFKIIMLIIMLIIHYLDNSSRNNNLIKWEEEYLDNKINLVINLINKVMEFSVNKIHL